MNTPHALGIHGVDQRKIEQVHPRFMREGLLRARTKTIHLYDEIKRQLTDGINELSARELALRVSKELGVTKHWHQPYIRFGPGSTLSFKSPLQASNILQDNQPVSIDLGPVWWDSETGLEYEGDFGNTFVFGNDSEIEASIEWTRNLFLEAKDHWRSERLSGYDLYRFFERRCSEAGFHLGKDFQGHRLSDFPHHNYTRLRLIDASFFPSEGVWVLELQVNDPKNRFGVFIEDLL